MAETQHNQPAANAAHFTDEPLLNAPAGVEARIAALIAPPAAQLGFRLVRVRLSGLNGCTLQIMAERADGGMTIEDCELLSQNISPLLDVENIVDRQYNLEISSPGMDRPLARKSDFAVWRGHLAKIETRSLIDGRKKFRGVIAAVQDDAVLLRTAGKDGGETELALPFSELAEANLVLTDDLIRAVLQRDKREHKQAAAEGPGAAQLK